MQHERQTEKNLEKNLKILENHFNKPSKPIKTLKDKSDFQTFSRVLDVKTKNILEKLKFNLKIKDCLQSGKEANIYDAVLLRNLQTKYTEIQREFFDISKVKNFVIKIYRTSTMEFKNRQFYLTEKYEKITNSRLLTKIWAEKELRNLMKIKKSGINCPAVLFLKRNVLVIQKIENNGQLAPRLKDLTEKYLIDNNLSFSDIYAQCLNLINNLFFKCKLIHADLSEYNILLSDKELYVIDVGQSVDIYHPNALQLFLNDVKNINNFFIKKKVKIMTEKEILENLIEEEINLENLSKLKFEDFLNLNKSEMHKEFNKMNKEKKKSEFNLKGLTKEEIKERRLKLKENRKKKRMEKNIKK